MLSKLQGLVLPERLRKLIKFNYLIRYRTRDIQACSMVPPAPVNRHHSIQFAPQFQAVCPTWPTMTTPQKSDSGRYKTYGLYRICGPHFGRCGEPYSLRHKAEQSRSFGGTLACMLREQDEPEKKTPDSMYPCFAHSSNLKMKRHAPRNARSLLPTRAYNTEASTLHKH
jgi:hypothetical protein